MNAKMPKIRQKANTSNVTPQRHPFFDGQAHAACMYLLITPNMATKTCDTF